MLILVYIFFFSFVLQTNSMMKVLHLPAVNSPKQALKVGSQLFEDKKYTEALCPLQQAYKSSSDVKSRLEAAQKMAVSILAQSPDVEELSLAIRYLNEARDQAVCEELLTEANYNLAVLHFKGHTNLKKDVKKSFELFRNVFNIGYKDNPLYFLSAYMLGLRYMQQYSVECNVNLAEKYFSIAHKQKVHSLLKDMAAAQLGFIHLVVDGNEVKAKEFLDEATGSRFGWAQEYAESIIAGDKRFFDGTEFLVFSNEVSAYVGEMPDLDLDDGAGVGNLS